MRKILILFTRHYLRFWILCLGIILGLMGFEELVDDVFHDPLEGDIESQVFDTSILSFIGKYRFAALNQVMMDLTALGSVSVILTFMILMISVLISYRDYLGILYQTIILAGAGLWPYTLKLYFKRPRPLDVEHLAIVTDFSFPSGHTFAATTLYLALAYYSAQFAKTWGQEVFFYGLGGVLIFLVGVSRIYLGVHFPTDVLAGICGGVVWAFLVTVIFEYKKVSKSRPGI